MGLDPLPPSTCVHLSLTPSPLRVDVINGWPLWLKGCLKMHFLQVECKSSSRSGADPDLQLSGGQIMEWGLGRRPQRGPGAKPLVRGQGDEIPPKLIKFF